MIRCAHNDGKGGIAIDEAAQAGTLIRGRLLEIADEVHEKTPTTARASAKGRPESATPYFDVT